jgi:hypothetical protein
MYTILPGNFKAVARPCVLHTLKLLLDVCADVYLRVNFQASIGQWHERQALMITQGQESSMSVTLCVCVSRPYMQARGAWLGRFLSGFNWGSRQQLDCLGWLFLLKIKLCERERATEREAAAG